MTRTSRRVIGTLLVASIMLIAGCGGPADSANATSGGAIGPTDGPAAGTDDPGMDDTPTDDSGMDETETTEDEMGMETTEDDMDTNETTEGNATETTEDDV